MQLPQALPLDPGNLHLKSFLRHRPLLLIGRGIQRDRLLDACRRLRAQDLTVGVLAGGIRAWHLAGGDVQADPLALLPALALLAWLLPAPAPTAGGRGCRSHPNDPAIQAAAARHQGGTPRATARNLYAFVAGHIQYAGYLRDDHGARYALAEGRGDCTEYMTLFLALARASDLPARGLAGFVTGRDARLQARDYHNWAEDYLQRMGRWPLYGAGWTV